MPDVARVERLEVCVGGLSLLSAVEQAEFARHLVSTVTQKPFSRTPSSTTTPRVLWWSQSVRSPN